MARRDDRAYREYVREEQRRQPGCPARELCDASRFQGTRDERFMNRRDALKAVLMGLLPPRTFVAPGVSTIIGSGSPGYSDSQVNNPYGVLVGRDGALYFCDLDNQRIRRLDLKTRRTIDIAGNGQRGYAGDGGRATAGSLN